MRRHHWRTDLLPWLPAVTGALGMLAACGAQPCDGGAPEGTGVQARLDVALNTCNHRPIAAAVRATSTATTKGVPVQLDGSGSTDVDGTPLQYAWRLLAAGPSAQLTNTSEVQATFSAAEAGAYTVELVVSDGELESLPAIVQLTVENSTPIADAGMDTPVAVGALATLDGRASVDPDGDALTYTWFFESRAPGSSVMLDDPTHPQPSFTVDRAGVYVIALRVFDGEATSEVARVRIGGGVTGGPPTADAGPDREGTLGLQQALDGSASSDPDGDALNYRWRWVSLPQGSGLPAIVQTSTSAFVNFVPDLEGDYVAELIVDDGFYSSPPAMVTRTVVPGTGVAGELCAVAGCAAGHACFDGVCVGVGRLRFSLSWTAYTDLDLHVLTPGGQEIAFDNAVAGGGELDVDDCVGSNCLAPTHVENIVFADQPTPGLYYVWVVNYNGDQPADFRIDVQGAAQHTFTGTMPQQTGVESMRFRVQIN